MRQFHRATGHLTANPSSYNAQQQIQYEVETNLQAPFSSAPQTLYELLDLRDLEASSPAQVAQRWNHCQLQPDYKDFVRQWDRAGSREKAGIEFRYALLYQEIKILEKIADLKGINLKCANAASSHRPTRCEYKESGGKSCEGGEKMQPKDKRKVSAEVARLWEGWRWSKARLQRKTRLAPRGRQGYIKLNGE